MFDKFKRHKPAQTRRMFHCNPCERRTIHKCFAGLQGSWSDPLDQIQGGNEYYIFKCGGCDTVIFVEDSWFSEDIFFNDAGEPEANITTIQYPPIVTKITEADLTYCPIHISKVIAEAASSLQSNNLLSATILAGITIKQVCKDLNISGRSLDKKIDNLKSISGIDQAQIDLLHAIRKRRNAGAHSAKAMSADEIRSGFEIISLIIENKYTIPGKTAAAVMNARRHLK